LGEILTDMLKRARWSST